MTKKFTVAILSFDGHKPLNCNYLHETFIVRTKGWGKARCIAMSCAKTDFVVMVNGDVEVKAEAWPIILSCKPDEFIMVSEGKLPCTRVFAIHKEAYNKVGFDASLKWIFEDGDFYARAIKQGLSCKVLPSKTFHHEKHALDIIFDPKKAFFADWEYSRMFAKYNFQVRRDRLYNFFLQPWHVKRIPFMIFRFFATAFWIIGGHFVEPERKVKT